MTCSMLGAHSLPEVHYILYLSCNTPLEDVPLRSVLTIEHVLYSSPTPCDHHSASCKCSFPPNPAPTGAYSPMAHTVVKAGATISLVELMPSTIPRESARIKRYVHQLVPPRTDGCCAFAALAFRPSGDIFSAAD